MVDGRMGERGGGGGGMAEEYSKTTHLVIERFAV